MVVVVSREIDVRFPYVSPFPCAYPVSSSMINPVPNCNSRQVCQNSYLQRQILDICFKELIKVERILFFESRPKFVKAVRLINSSCKQVQPLIWCVKRLIKRSESINLSANDIWSYSICLTNQSLFLYCSNIFCQFGEWQVLLFKICKWKK
jgi:hypothetical protein